MRIEKFILILLIFSSCTQQSKKEGVTQDTVTVVSNSSEVVIDSNSVDSLSAEDLFKFEAYLVKSKVNGADVQTISESSVLVVNPTDEQIDEMIKEYGEEDFSTIAEDASFYQADAISLIDSLGVKSVNAEKPYALLVGEKTPWTINLRKEGAPGWMLIFFNKNKTPEIVPAIDVNREMLTRYFELK